MTLDEAEARYQQLIAREMCDIHLYCAVDDAELWREVAIVFRKAYRW